MDKKKHLNKVGPAKPATITDVALRLLLNDLIDRGQIPVLREFASELGFSTSNPLTYFLQGQRNYPRHRIEDSIKVLKEKYQASENFLMTGHGQMYKGKPYVMKDVELSVKDHGNIMSIGTYKAIQKLEELNEQLRQKIKEMEELIKMKDMVIESKTELIQRLKKEK